MCGRFDRHSELSAFAELIEGLVLESDPGLASSYNIAPSQSALVVAQGTDGNPKARSLQWGLLPGWVSKSGLSRPINARIETAAEKPMFRNAFKKRRCVVLCDGYYEWCSTESGKQPYYFYAGDHRPFVLAGLWESNSKLTDETQTTFSIMTRQANTKVEEIHHRMPLIPDREFIREWLNPLSSPAELQQAGQSHAITDLNFYPVGTFVNSPSNNATECLKPIAV
ncbi:MAG: putative SOS response-associated peptidase YedK [Parasphingorhabdus sp.]|jgi:putative SOS response-associated peptidase YedK